jgi:hypothetical protein
VSSVSEDHLAVYTFSTVVSSLSTKLPTQLQIDWGQHAYKLRPNLPSLKDFDYWIDIAVGAEKYRGNRFSTPIASTQKNVTTPALRQQSSYGAANSVAYRGPTKLSQSVKEDTTRFPIPQCAACNENPEHRLENCNTFKKMLINTRAAFVADSNHCFKCLSKGHYGRNFRKTTIKCSSCGEAHHTLLHGADWQFPKKIGNLKILLVRAPSKSLRSVLLAILPVMAQEGDVSVKSFALLDPGIEATIMSRALTNR